MQRKFMQRRLFSPLLTGLIVRLFKYQMTSIQARNVNHPDHRENLKEEKYNLIREAMLASLRDDAWMAFSELEDMVRAWLDGHDVPKALFPKPGSVRWYCKAVQLDLEACKEIERQPKKSPLHLRKCRAG